jgi:hypothetical protein
MTGTGTAETRPAVAGLTACINQIFRLSRTRDVGDPDCGACIVPDIHGAVADLVCNECGSVVKHDVAVTDVKQMPVGVGADPESHKYKLSALRGAERLPTLLGDGRFI